MRSTLPSLKFTVVCTCKFTVNTLHAGMMFAFAWSPGFA
jgi:hypothetical protein